MNYKLEKKKPNLKYYRVFGSECYVLRNGENLGKFDSKSDLGIFIGYSNKSKASKVYNQNSQVIQESSNVAINDCVYHDIIENEYLTLETIGDNPENVDNIENHPEETIDQQG